MAKRRKQKKAKGFPWIAVLGGFGIAAVVGGIAWSMAKPASPTSNGAQPNGATGSAGQFDPRFTVS